jgi:cell division protein FtsB
MNNAAWRRKFALPPGYVQESLFTNEPERSPEHVILYFLGSMFFFVLFAVFLTQQIYLSGLNRKIAATEQQLGALHRENEALRLEYTRAENLVYVERVAVNRLKMVRPTQVYYLSPLEFAAR